MSLKRWLENNSNAIAGDIAAAENVLKDLENALMRNSDSLVKYNYKASKSVH